MPSATAAVADQRHQPPSKQTQLQTLMEQRILLLDGAYGTAFQGYQLEEEAYRGERFAEHDLPLKGNHDILCLTCPEIVEEVHRSLSLIHI